MKEYTSGSEYEIYRVPLSPVFGGCLFSNAAQIVFEEAQGVVLFALDILEPSMRVPILALCPLELIIPSSSKVRIHAYCLARNRREAEIASQIAPVERSRGGSRLQRRASLSDLLDNNRIAS